MKHPTLLSRLQAAVSLVFKSGAPFPFNKILPYDATGGEKMYHAFEQSTWVMRAVKKIAGPIAAVDLHFTRAGERFRDPALEAFWETPGAGLTRTDMIEATVGWLKLEGEAFWIMDDSWMAPFAGAAWTDGKNGKNGKYALRNPLIVARPDRMRHVVKNGALEGWEYSDAAGNREMLLPEQVVQLKMWNPYNDWRGMAELKPCRDAAEADFLAGKFNLNLMRSNGDQGVYVIAKEGLPLDGQRQQIVDQIREKRELAQRGVFKPAFLDGNITIEDPKIRVPDADFLAARLQNRHEVFIAMGVPASMADVKASYSIGSASDWFMLIAETCIPLGEKICQGINQVLRRQCGPDARASLNWDEHPVIQAVRRERADTAQKYFAMGVPLKALNDYLDLELPPCPAWEKGYLAFNLTAIGEEEAAADLPETTDDTVALMRRELGAAARLRRALTAEKGGEEGLRIADCGLRIADGKNGTDGTHEERTDGPPSTHRLTDSFTQNSPHERPEAELAQWRGLMAQRQPLVKGFVSRFNRELMKARGETLRQLDRKAAGSNVFDVEGFAKGLAAALRPAMAAALQKAGEELFAEAGCAEAFAMPAGTAAEFLRRHEAIWREEAARIGGEISEAVAGAEGQVNCGLRIADCGLGMGEGRGDEPAGAGNRTAADAVRARFNEIAKRRAQELALNEMAAAFGLARDTAMRMAGVAAKRWLSSGQENVSAAHLAANGQVVAVDGVFAVGAERLAFPGDEAGSVRSCRCVAVCAGGGKAGRDLKDQKDARDGLDGTDGSAENGSQAPCAKGMTGALRRTIHPEVRVVDSRNGIVDYIASDESIDSFKEIIRAAGWRFTHFAKNAPFVDSHDYSTIGKCLGKVIDFRVEGARLIERVQWAIDVPENQLARIGWKMTEAGYLKAVSVGFFPVKYVTPNSVEEWGRQLKELGLPADAAVRTIYTEQEQVELSCCVVGSNPNALAKAYQAGALNDADMETLSLEYSQRENGRAAVPPALAAPAREQARARFLAEWRKAMQHK